MSVAIGLIIACTLLPFLPGSYDSLAVPLSGMVQLAGMGGLLLVPVGAVWLAYEYRSRRGGSGVESFERGRHRFAMAALITGAAVCLLGSFIALMVCGVSAGIIIFALSAYAVVRIAHQMKRQRSEPQSLAAAPFYLVLLPIAVVALQMAPVPRATAFSRDRAMRNSAPLIADIERYRAARGLYPPSLAAVWKDYSPGVIGVEQYRYEPQGDAYNVFFEQFAPRFGTREFVMYNPLDQQVMTSHAMDLLHVPPAELERERGYYAVHAAGQEHRKYFWFD